MAGAFVAVADDASAVYWNPAGLGSGSFFSLVLDLKSAEGQVPVDTRASATNGTLVALGTPPLGLSYYRLQAVEVRPPQGLIPAPPAGTRAGEGASLTTHHIGVTLVQSLFEGLTVGTTLRLVRGDASSGLVIGGDPDDLVDEAGDLPTSGETAFDADIGLKGVWGAWRAGLTVRNVVEPDFEVGPDTEVTMRRLTRAGVARQIGEAVLLAADIDLERVSSGLGDARRLSVGAEANVFRKTFIRSGFGFNTLGDQPGGHAPVLSVGASYAVFGSMLVDAQATVGSEAGGRGWGIAGRVVF